ncbi:hypothetical protein HID58_028625 [Brassica napus]|uniref:Uncharacterized protein n=1 Tax=Brassica napus TaxID=3708 RepID=A0ABQ8CAR7_BRANA|nr:hypothetical protein HID58_028625 [Brassica napus]
MRQGTKNRNHFPQLGSVDDVGTYVMMSDIYKRSVKREEAAEMRMKMKERALKKPPGCSWIPFGFQTHAFVVGDLSHPQLEAFNWVVTDLSNKMRKKKRTRLQLLKNMILTSVLLCSSVVSLHYRLALVSGSGHLLRSSPLLAKRFKSAAVYLFWSLDAVVGCGFIGGARILGLGWLAAAVLWLLKRRRWVAAVGFTDLYGVVVVRSFSAQARVRGVCCREVVYGFLVAARRLFSSQTPGVECIASHRFSIVWFSNIVKRRNNLVSVVAVTLLSQLHIPVPVAYHLIAIGPSLASMARVQWGMTALLRYGCSHPVSPLIVLRLATRKNANLARSPIPATSGDVSGIPASEATRMRRIGGDAKLDL